MPRIKNDNYPTESAMLVPLLALQEGQMIKGRILEPCAGAGGIASPLRAAGYNVITNDKYHGEVTWRCYHCGEDTISSMRTTIPKCSGNVCSHCGMPSDPPKGHKYLAGQCVSHASYKTNYVLDIAERKSWLEFQRFDWVITNPPFSQLETILDMSLVCAEKGVAMLLRLTALEPAIRRTKRGEILEQYKDHMRYLMPFSAPRPKFDATKKGTDSVTTAWVVWDKGWRWSSHGIECPFQFIVNWKNL